MHDFHERLNFSEGVELNQNILRHIYEMIPGAIDLERADKRDDKNGTDYWIRREHGLPNVSIDMKNREFCPIERFNRDDACIETCSVFQNGERRKIGWSLDESKRTDLIVYTWPNPKGRRFWIVWFPLLCQAARLNWEEWKKKFPERPAPNDGYQTLSIYPLRKVITESMREMMVGVK